MTHLNPFAHERPPTTTILIVDDESPIRAVERRLLEDSGYAVLEAATGAEGIEVMAANTSIDLMVADLNMPALDGAEMVRRVRLTRPDLRVLYVTGYIDRLLDARLLWEGEAFLEKPFSAAGLSQAVSLLLHGKTGSGPSEPT